jgi:hypothetical protein
VDKLLISPPVAFIIVLASLFALAKLLSRLAYRAKGEQPIGAGKSYACGEDIADHTAQPDYSQVFPFAFFFTIGHVAALILATVPAGAALILVPSVIYVIAIAISLYILLRR